MNLNKYNNDEIFAIEDLDLSKALEHAVTKENDDYYINERRLTIVKNACKKLQPIVDFYKCNSAYIGFGEHTYIKLYIEFVQVFGMMKESFEFVLDCADSIGVKNITDDMIEMTFFFKDIWEED